MKEFKECNELKNKFTTTYCDANDNDEFNFLDYDNELDEISKEINQKTKDFIAHFRKDENKQECIGVELNIISKSKKCSPYKPKGIKFFLLVNEEDVSSIIKVCEKTKNLADKGEISFDDLSELNEYADKILVTKKPNDVYDRKVYDDNKIVVYSIFDLIDTKNLADMIFSLFSTYQNYDEEFVKENYSISLDSVGYYVK